MLPSRYHAIHKNDLARAMFEGALKALVEMKQRQIPGGAPPQPQVMFYEYGDMKLFFNDADASN